MINEVERRALAMVGVPFRPQGRGPDGCDCVGLIVAALGLSDDSVRRDYRMRGHGLAEVRDMIERHCRRVARGRARGGDVLLLRVAPDQLHLAVVTERGHVHAHARLRKVVETPGAPDAPVVAVYRKRLRPVRNG